MVKKIFPFFLIFILLVIILSYYQKDNPVVQKMLNKINGETTKPNTVINQPTGSIQKTVNVSEKIFLQVDQPENNITVNNPIINISGKTIANAFIFINEQELKADINGNFSTATTLDEGENEIIIVASDDLGNSIEKDIVVNLESTQ